jgi:hypothetical protein
MSVQLSRKRNLSCADRLRESLDPAPHAATRHRNVATGANPSIPTRTRLKAAQRRRKQPAVDTTRIRGTYQPPESVRVPSHYPAVERSDTAGAGVKWPPAALPPRLKEPGLPTDFRRTRI